MRWCAAKAELIRAIEQLIVAKENPFGLNPDPYHSLHGALNMPDLLSLSIRR